MKQANIWNCFETTCWSMGFDYENYKSYFNKNECQHNPLTEEGYKEFCKFHNNEMSRNFEAS